MDATDRLRAFLYLLCLASSAFFRVAVCEPVSLKMIRLIGMDLVPVLPLFFFVTL